MIISTKRDGTKLIHDLSFRRSVDSFSPSLEWLALYGAAEKGDWFSEAIAGKLERAIQDQNWFFGPIRGRHIVGHPSRFVRQIMAEVDAHMNRMNRGSIREKGE